MSGPIPARECNRRGNGKLEVVDMKASVLAVKKTGVTFGEFFWSVLTLIALNAVVIFPLAKICSSIFGRFW